MMYKIFKWTIICSFIFTSSYADICDYRLSKLLSGSTTKKTVDTTLDASSVVPVDTKALGFYTLKRTVNILPRLGSSSAAGTVGIIAGTAGATAAKISGFALNPITLATGVVIGGGSLFGEVYCHFTVIKVDDPKIIMGILKHLSENSDPKEFMLLKKNSWTKSDGFKTGYIYLAEDIDENGVVLKRSRFEIEKLYVEDGMLMHKSLGINREIGKLNFVFKDENSKEEKE